MKKKRLQRLLSRLNNSEYGFDRVGRTVSTLKSDILGEISNVRKDLDQKGIRKALKDLRKLIDDRDTLSRRDFKTMLDAEMAKLDTETDLSGVYKAIESLRKDVSRTFDTNDENDRKYAQKVTESLRRLEESVDRKIESAGNALLGRIDLNRGGSMNRQILVNGVDVLTKYTDINLVGSITATADDAGRNVDIDFSAVGGVDSVSNSDGTLVISPTTGNVVASVNPALVLETSLSTPIVRAGSSAGILFESNNGTDVALFGAGGGSNATFYGGVNVVGNLTVDTDVLYVDTANNRVGLGTSSPSARLDIYNGDLIFGLNTYDATIKIADITSGDSLQGGDLTVSAGSATAGSNMAGGHLILKAGNSRTGAGHVSGDLRLYAGANNFVSGGVFGDIEFYTGGYSGSYTQSATLIGGTGNMLIGTTTDVTAFGGARLQVKSSGSSTGTWRGRIVAGGDNYVFLMGEYNSNAWLGAHNAALSAWAPLYIQPQGGSDVGIGYDGTTLNTSTDLVLGGRFSAGVTSASAKIHAVSTTEQLRLGYDANNYFSTTVASNGAVSLNATSSGTVRQFGIGNFTPSITAAQLQVRSTASTGQADFQYSATQYYRIRNQSTGGVILDAVGTSPVHSVRINGTESFQIAAGGVLSSTANNPVFYLNGSDVGGAIGAGYLDVAGFGIYSTDSDQVIADYNLTTGTYRYFGGALYGGSGGGIGSNENLTMSDGAEIYRSSGSILRMGSSGSVYLNVTQNSTTGVMTFDLTGGSAPEFAFVEKALFSGEVEMDGALNHDGTTVGLYGVTPVTRATTGIAEAAFVENAGGTAVNADSTFGGYTLQQVVQALQSIGILT